MSSNISRNNKMIQTCTLSTTAETAPEVRGNRLESVSNIRSNVNRSSSCHKSFINLFELACVVFLVVHVFIQPTPTSAIRLQVHKVTDKSMPDKRGANFEWTSHPTYDYPNLADQGAPQSSDFAVSGLRPFLGWNLDGRRAGGFDADYEAEAMPAFDSTQGGAMSPSTSLYLTEKLLAKYMAQTDKQEQQRKRKAFMHQVFGLH